MRKLHFSLWMLLSLLWLSSAWGATRAEKTLNGLIVEAHRAYAKKRLTRVLDLLQRAETSLRRLSSKIRPRLRDNIRLWIAYLRSSSHQGLALLPPLDPIESFEEAQALQEQLRALRKPLAHLEAAIFQLRIYQRLYRRVRKQSRSTSATALLALSNRIKLLENRSQLLKLRISRLKIALRLRKLERRKVSRLRRALKAQGRSLAKLRKAQLQFTQKLSRRGLAYQRAHQEFLKRDLELQKRGSLSPYFLWGGGIAVTLGVIGALVGAYYLATFKTQNLPCQTHPPQEWKHRGNAYCELVLGSVLGVGLGVVVVGVAGLVVGLLVATPKHRYYQNLLRSHQSQLRPNARLLGSWP